MTDDDRIWYGTFFDHCHCDHPTRSGEVCRLAPQWVERATGQRLCYVHAPIKFKQLLLLKAASEEAHATT